ncbi:DUF4417 domain-containing protein [Aerococcaceae bacterium NML160702]|nr:DUF4417 domain-containing protein [Aerococcaceae bacterium NML160702]
MKVEVVDISEIKEYAGNAKLHPDWQVEGIAKSIEQYGYNDPISIDENNVIIEGHGRYAALKKLGYTEVAVIRLSHMDEVNKKGYALAHNGLTLETGFDIPTLKVEIEDIGGEIDMSQFGFDDLLADEETKQEHKSGTKEEVEDEDEPAHHRDMTINQYNLMEYDPNRVDGFYDMPTLEAVDHVPANLIGFNYVLNKPDRSSGVHFYLDDYQFERIWQRPHYYIEKLTEFDCVLTPDFSLYLDMPVAMQVWNIYRSRLIGQLCQDYGIKVIPTVSWAEKDSFAFCFDGLPTNSTLSISTIGVKQDKAAFQIWQDGVTEMIKRLSPNRLIVYGGMVEYDYGDIEVIYYENAVTERMKRSGR